MKKLLVNIKYPTFCKMALYEEATLCYIKDRIPIGVDSGTLGETNKNNSKF